MDPIAPQHQPQCQPEAQLQTEKCPPPIVAPTVGPPPCYFWSACSARAALEKAGRSVCRRCAARLCGVEYPLREASIEPIYLTPRAAAEALDMVTTSIRNPSDHAE
jgi:hypothetical protein